MLYHLNREPMRKPFTDLRKAILGLIEKSRVPLTVQQVLDALPEKCDLSNVYRGIRYLEKERLIESFSLDCEQEGNARFYCGAGAHHVHFIHCEKCHKFTRISECFLDGHIADLERNYGHNISRHMLVLMGVCRKCARAA
jgi:Fur family ferric uptake transcriptional regulator